MASAACRRVGSRLPRAKAAASSRVGTACMLVILAAQTSCAGCNPSVAQRCLELGASDGLLILDVQNAFMEERSVQRGVRPSYNTSAGASNGTLPRGALSVSNSSGIIDTINAWIERRNDDGKDAAIIATLDYHPPGHCSFCDVANGGIDPLTAEGLLQFCLQGRQTWSLDETAGAVHLNDSHRCRDAVSEASWDASLYYQWPIRAVAGTFDARFDPYLQLPEDTVVFKLGTQVTADSYSAFDGGRRSSAAAGMHDIQPSSTSALDNSTHTLETELAARGIKRLFVFGLATDYVVGQTVYNALGLGSFIAPITQLLGGSVVIVDTGVRAIGTSDAVYENILLRDITTYLLQYGTYPDGVVLTSTAPEAALMEFFTRGLGTCDSVEECEASYTSDARNEYFCKPLKGLQWGECVACPIADGSTAICSGAGECHAYCTARDSDDASGLCSSLEDASASTHTHSGVCMCDFLRSGDACEYNAITTFVTLLVILGFGCCGSTILLCFYFYRRYNKPGLRLESTGLPPELTLEKGHEYHLFLSHIWATGQDQVAVIKRSLTSLLPGVKIFLDVDDLNDIDQLEKHIKASAVILVFLSAGYFKSRNCLREIRAAVAHEKPLILVHESDPTKGGAPLKELKEMCPADLRHAIFSEPKAQKLSKGSFNNEGSEDEPPTARLVVPWHRLVAFQLESLRQIAEVTLLHSPRYKSFLTKGKKLDLFLPQRVGHHSMITDFKYSMESPHMLITSANNPGAAEAAEELAESLKNVNHSRIDAPDEDSFAEALHSIIGSGQTLHRKKTYGLLAVVRKGSVRQLPPLKKSESAAIHSAREGSVWRGRKVAAAGPRPVAVSNCHMVVYLNEQAFAQESLGEALASNVRDAMAAGVSMLVLHEREAEHGALPFEHFYQITPEDLVRRGLYRQLATPWYHGQHARVSRAVAAGAMGASRKMRRTVHERQARAGRRSSTGDKIAPAPQPDKASTETAVQPPNSG